MSLIERGCVTLPLPYRYLNILLLFRNPLNADLHKLDEWQTLVEPDNMEWFETDSEEDDDDDEDDEEEEEGDMDTE